MEDASIKPVDYMDEAAVSEYDQLAQSLNDPRANPTRDKDIKDWEQALGHPLTAGPLPVYVDSTGKAFDPKHLSPIIPSSCQRPPSVMPDSTTLKFV
jgi:hypothetical protein